MGWRAGSKTARRRRNGRQRCATGRSMERRTRWACVQHTSDVGMTIQPTPHEWSTPANWTTRSRMGCDTGRRSGPRGDESKGREWAIDHEGARRKRARGGRVCALESERMTVSAGTGTIQHQERKRGQSRPRRRGRRRRLPRLRVRWSEHRGRESQHRRATRGWSKHTHGK